MLSFPPLDACRWNFDCVVSCASYSTSQHHIKSAPPRPPLPPPPPPAPLLPPPPRPPRVRWPTRASRIRRARQPRGRTRGLQQSTRRSRGWAARDAASPRWKSHRNALVAMASSNSENAAAIKSGGVESLVSTVRRRNSRRGGGGDEPRADRAGDSRRWRALSASWAWAEARSWLL